MARKRGGKEFAIIARGDALVLAFLNRLPRLETQVQSQNQPQTQALALAPSQQDFLPVLVGSRAVHHYFAAARKANDIDVIITLQDALAWLNDMSNYIGELELQFLPHNLENHRDSKLKATTQPNSALVPTATKETAGPSDELKTEPITMMIKLLGTCYVVSSEGSSFRFDMEVVCGSTPFPLQLDPTDREDQKNEENEERGFFYRMRMTDHDDSSYSHITSRPTSKHSKQEPDFRAQLSMLGLQNQMAVAMQGSSLDILKLAAVCHTRAVTQNWSSSNNYNNTNVEHLANTNVNVQFLPAMLAPANRPCLVAPLALLEALKTSHIHWPAYFAKHIQDLHSLRRLLQTAEPSLIEPVKPPVRPPAIQQILQQRYAETKAIRGVPGAHINLNMTNEEFLERDDDLMVERFVPHDDIHMLVKYGAVPIYDTLKHDKSKAYVARDLFEKADYLTQLRCVREEAMTIALERYLVPQLSEQDDWAYANALMRVCTTLTKGWFRDFAIDNYERLRVCDKALLPIAKQIRQKHPRSEPQEPRAEFASLVSDLEQRAIVEPLFNCTQSFKLRKGAEQDDTLVIRLPASVAARAVAQAMNITEASPISQSILSEMTETAAVLVTWEQNFFSNYDDCNPSANWSAMLAIRGVTLPVSASIAVVQDVQRRRYADNEDEEVEEEDEEEHDDEQQDVKMEDVQEEEQVNGTLLLQRNTMLNPPKSFKATDMGGLVLCSHESSSSGGSWSAGNNSWSSWFHAFPISQAVERLGIPDLTEELLLKYILAWIQPSLQQSGNIPFRRKVDRDESIAQNNCECHYFSALFRMGADAEGRAVAAREKCDGMKELWRLADGRYY